jgi:hypothetical protein
MNASAVFYLFSPGVGSNLRIAYSAVLFGGFMKISEGCAAVASGHRQEWHYGGYAQVVEVEACGFKDDHVVARAWLVSGGEANRREAWSLYRLSETYPIRELVDLCEAPHNGHEHPDLRLDATACEARQPVPVLLSYEC